MIHSRQALIAPIYFTIKRTVQASLILITLVLYSRCASVSSAAIKTPYRFTAVKPQWKTLAAGIDTFDLYNPQLPLIVHMVKIDLSHPSVSVITSEAELFTNSTGTLRAESTLDFALRHHTAVACNAAPFKTHSILFDRYRIITGIHITDFQQMSMPNKRYGALLFYTDNTACIIDSQTDTAFSKKIRHAVGGFFIILRDGAIIPQIRQHRDSRTAVGLDATGKKLFIAVVEGENKRKSCGLTFEETAVLMQVLGAHNALQLDGGSSSTLVIRKNGIQRTIAPNPLWNIRIRVASNLGIQSASVP